MKKNINSLIVFIIVCLMITACDQNEAFQVNVQNEKNSKFSELRGPYLGQNPPGEFPEIFAPGIISTGNKEVCISFSPDAKEMFYSIAGYPFSLIVTTKEINGVWQEPKTASFFCKYSSEFLMTPDGQNILISSGAPLNQVGEPNSNWGLWKAVKKDGEWRKSRPMPEPFNSDKYSIDCVSQSLNGNLYFFSNDYPGLKGDTDILMSEKNVNDYKEIKILGKEINSESWELDPFIAKDESYIIFSSNKDGGVGRFDLYISFKNTDGSWTKAKNMGDKINSKFNEVHPYVTIDGKYLFFCSNRYSGKRYTEEKLSYKDKLDFLGKAGNGNDDIYWVDAKVIEELRPTN